MTRGGAARSLTDPDVVHRSAVASTLSWADAAAGRGRHREALAWLITIEAIGDMLPAEYEVKRTRWRSLVAQDECVRDAIVSASASRAVV